MNQHARGSRVYLERETGTCAASIGEGKFIDFLLKVPFMKGDVSQMLA